MDILALIKELGWQIGIIVFFIWWSWKREKGLVNRLDVLEDYQRKELQELVTKTTETLIKNTEVMEKFCDQFKLKRKGDSSDTEYIIARDH